MPFTVSHVAAVLPGASTSLPTAALVIGAMSPDIPYFLPPGPWTLPTHTVAGIVLWAPLLGFVAVLAWYVLVARPAYAWAPAQVRARLLEPVSARERVGSVRALSLVYAALVVGAATHVLWDAFTHADGWVVERVPGLRQGVAWLPGDLAVYRGLQYASSLIGLVILAGWVVRWWRAAPVRHVDPGTAITDAARWYVATSVVVAGLLGAAVGSWPHLASPDGLNLRRAAFRAITVGGAVAVMVVLVLALAWVLGQARRSGTTPRT
jgi:hypothetical protein